MKLKRSKLSLTELYQKIRDVPKKPQYVTEVLINRNGKDVLYSEPNSFFLRNITPVGQMNNYVVLILKNIVEKLSCDFIVDNYKNKSQINRLLFNTKQIDNLLISEIEKQRGDHQHD